VFYHKPAIAAHTERRAVGETTRTEPEVDNPIYTDLVRLRDYVRGLAPTLGGALDSSAAAMGSNEVWTGPTARGWNQELSGRKGRLSQAAAHLEAAVNEKLATVDPKVPASTARMIRKGLL
jgi:hypothetical protein